MKTLRIANIVALLVMLAANGLASATDLVGGQQTAAVSDKYPTLFTPAGYVFGIWGIIYVGLIALAVYQARRTPEAEAVVGRLGPWFTINALLNAAWLFLWGAELLWGSVAAMLGILATLIVLYERLGIGRAPASPGERWAVRLPISIYTGWISVATIANIASALVSSGFEGWLPGNVLGPQYWFMLMLLAATALGLLAAIWRCDAAYALVIVWAFAGIAVARAPHPDYTALDLAATVCAAIVAFGIVLGQARRGKRLSLR